MGMYRGGRILDWLSRWGASQIGPRLEEAPALPVAPERLPFAHPEMEPALGPLWRYRYQECTRNPLTNVLQINPDRYYDTVWLTVETPQSQPDLGLAFGRAARKTGFVPLPAGYATTDQIEPHLHFPAPTWGYLAHYQFCVPYGNAPFYLWHCGCIVTQFCVTVNLLRTGRCCLTPEILPFGTDATGTTGGGFLLRRDRFNRGDLGTGSLGTEELGQPWITGTHAQAFAIVGDRAMATALATPGGQTVTWVVSDKDPANQVASAQARMRGYAGGSGAFPGLVSNLGSDGAFYAFCWDVDRMALVKYSAGVRTVLARAAAAALPADGSLLTLIHTIEDNLYGYVNGVETAVANDATHSGRVRWGLFFDNVLQQADDWGLIV